jgi:hypothetical protein
MKQNMLRCECSRYVTLSRLRTALGHQRRNRAFFSSCFREISMCLLFFLIVLVTGCATFPIELSKTRVVPPGESAVFGRVIVLVEGKTRTFTTWGGSYLCLYLQPSSGSEAYETWVRQEDGYFYWHLPSGTYTLAGYRFMEGHGTTKGRIFAEFSVPEGKPLVYVGDMTMALGSGRQHIRFDDNSEEAARHFKGAFPEIQGLATTSLMRLENQK